MTLVSFTVSLGLMLLTLAPSAHAQPKTKAFPEAIHLASGSWETADALEELPRLRFFHGAAAEAKKALGFAFTGPVRTADGALTDATKLAAKIPGKSHFLLWVSPPLANVVALDEGLLLKAARAQLDVGFRSELPEGDPVPARRWFGLWSVPKSQPLLFASVKVRRPDESTARARYLGPGGGYSDSARGWRSRDTTILRPPPQAMPGMMKAILEKEARGSPVAFEILAQGFDSGPIKKPVRRLLRSPGQVAREWGRLHAWSMPRPPVPDFDPKKHLVIAIYRGTVARPARALQVAGVFEQPDTSLVVMLGADDNAPQAEEIDQGNSLIDQSPYVWIRVERKATTRAEVHPLGR